MADQHFNLRSVASQALHFSDGVEEIQVNVVVLDDTPGLGDIFIMLYVLSVSVRGEVFYSELLELVLVNGYTNNVLQ